MSRNFLEICNDLRDDLNYLIEYIHNHPELGNEEFLSCKAHMEVLEKHGFEIEKNIEGVETAFIARFESGVPGPKIAYLAEYDALPELGHACGHNVLGAVSTVAAIALSKVVKETGGTVYLYGTPAEETCGFKVILCEKNLMKDIDVAMVAHPASFDEASGTSVALVPFRVVFHGVSAHAGASPEKGINALDAAIFLFNGVNALREHVPEDVRMHGIIKEGGTVPNTVPNKSVVDYYLRAKSMETINDLEKKFKNIVEGAALMTGATYEFEDFELPFDAMQTNETLSKAFCEAFEAISERKMKQGGHLAGSIDMGNVSNVVPSIHPWFDISGDSSLALHTKGFAQAAGGQLAKERAAIVAAALAETGYKVLTDKELLKRIKAEFAETMNK